MDIIKILRVGAGIVADSYTNPRDYTRSSKDGFRRDQAKLVNDVRTVGNDIKTTIGRHGQQAYKSSGR
jgi:hypothetical protein